MKLFKTIMLAVLVVVAVIVVLNLIFWALGLALEMIFWLLIAVVALSVFFYVRKKLT